MLNSWKRPLENLPKEMTTIWSCTKEGCNGWIRASYSFEKVPVCAKCQSSMVKSEKILPKLFSSDQELKHYKNNQRKSAK